MLRINVFLLLLALSLSAVICADEDLVLRTVLEPGDYFGTSMGIRQNEFAFGTFSYPASLVHFKMSSDSCSIEHDRTHPVSVNPIGGFISSTILSTLLNRTIASQYFPSRLFAYDIHLRLIKSVEVKDIEHITFMLPSTSGEALFLISDGVPGKIVKMNADTFEIIKIGNLPNKVDLRTADVGYDNFIYIGTMRTNHVKSAVLRVNPDSLDSSWIELPDPSDEAVDIQYLRRQSAPRDMLLVLARNLVGSRVYVMEVSKMGVMTSVDAVLVKDPLRILPRFSGETMSDEAIIVGRGGDWVSIDYMKRTELEQGAIDMDQKNEVITSIGIDPCKNFLLAISSARVDIKEKDSMQPPAVVQYSSDMKPLSGATLSPGHSGIGRVVIRQQRPALIAFSTMTRGPAFVSHVSMPDYQVEASYVVGTKTSLGPVTYDHAEHYAFASYGDSSMGILRLDFGMHGLKKTHFNEDAFPMQSGVVNGSLLYYCSNEGGSSGATLRRLEIYDLSEKDSTDLPLQSCLPHAAVQDTEGGYMYFLGKDATGRAAIVTFDVVKTKIVLYKVLPMVIDASKPAFLYYKVDERMLVLAATTDIGSIFVLRTPDLIIERPFNFGNPAEHLTSAAMTLNYAYLLVGVRRNQETFMFQVNLNPLKIEKTFFVPSMANVLPFASLDFNPSLTAISLEPVCGRYAVIGTDRDMIHIGPRLFQISLGSEAVPKGVCSNKPSASSGADSTDIDNKQTVHPANHNDDGSGNWILSISIIAGKED
jgi:hypothetical protein